MDNSVVIVVGRGVGESGRISGNGEKKGKRKKEKENPPRMRSCPPAQLGPAGCSWRPSEARTSLLHHTRVPGRSHTAGISSPFKEAMHVVACGREQEARSWSTLRVGSPTRQFLSSPAVWISDAGMWPSMPTPGFPPARRRQPPLPFQPILRH